MKRIILLLLGVVMCSSSVTAQSPTGNPDYEQRAHQELERLTLKQVKKISDTANSTDSGNEHNIKGYILSAHIRSFKDIPEGIDANIKELKKQAQVLIRTVAIDIEVNGGTSGTLSIDESGRVQYKPNPSLPKELNTKREALLRAGLENSVSIRSAAMAIQLLAGINDSLREQAARATTRQEKEEVFMQQAIFVYEMADITLELLNGLTLEGKKVIDNLHQDVQKKVRNRIAEIKVEQQRLRDMQQANLISSENASNDIESLELVQKANERNLDAWKKVIAKMGKQEEFLKNLQKKKALVESKRNQAKIQLETLRDLRQLAELRDAIGSLDELVASIADLDLLRLDEDTVNGLLGYNIKYVPNRD